MQEYDVALKLLLRGSAKLTMRELTGSTVETWLDIEMSKVQNPRVDLLGETAEKGLVHLELQSGNDATMPLDVWFRYRVFDIRELDGERLLESEDVGDNVIAILARLRDHKDAVRRIVERIAGLVPAERATALGQLLILAGLRNPATWCSILSSN
jgi:DNA-binding transcriptional ArsR family regulator